MAHLECYRETETAIFATRTNLPVSDFQTWQVCACVDIGQPTYTQTYTVIVVIMAWCLCRHWPAYVHTNIHCYSSYNGLVPV